MQQYQASFNKVVDKLFSDLVNSKDPSPDYFQAKIDLIVEKFVHDVGHLVYKLYICQAVVHFCKQDYLDAIDAIERSDEARAGREIHREYEKVKNQIGAQSHVVLGKLQSIIDRRNETKEIGAAALKAIFYGIGLLVLGAVITGISYSATDPGGTYTVASGLFLVGGIYVCVGGYRAVRWVARKCV